MQVEILGCERYLRIDVVFSDQPVTIDWQSELDPVGAYRLRAISHLRYTGFTAQAKVSWRDAAARNECRRHEITMAGTNGTRWDDVEQYAALLRCNIYPKCGPVFFHPSITGSADLLLRPIDGARRMMSAAEVSIGVIDAVVIFPLHHL